MIAEGKNQALAAEQIESLRNILEREQMREVSHGEATEVGQSLLDFFELLAERTPEAEA